ncbi:MAG: DUF3953 domain-containing protein [Saccharofermentanales bacterium]
MLLSLSVLTLFTGIENYKEKRSLSILLFIASSATIIFSVVAFITM